MPSLYNIVIDRHMFNALEVVLSALYHTMEYPFYKGRIRVIKVRYSPKKCYRDIFKIKKRLKAISPKPNAYSINFVDLDEKEEFMEDQLMPKKDLNMVHISSQIFQTNKVGKSILKSEEDRIMILLLKT